MAPSPVHPAGTAPHGALEAECRWRKCRWSCCNIYSETEGDGKKSGTHSFIRCPCIAECSPNDNLQQCFTYHFGSVSLQRSVRVSALCKYSFTVCYHDSSNTAGELSHSCKKRFQHLNRRLKIQLHCLQITVTHCGYRCRQQASPRFPELSSSLHWYVIGW